jgi:hypothetical protein
MSKFKQWFDAVDPYAIQRVALYKALFIATIVVYVYWLFLPVNLMAFIVPFFLVSIYEMPILSSFKKKEHLLIFICVGVSLVSVSFYMVYPFKGVFFFFSLFVLSSLYFFVLKYFYDLKNVIMTLLAIGTIVLDTEPFANLEIVYGLVSSTALSSVTVFVCLRIFPNQYLKIWNIALQKFIKYFEEDIAHAVLHDSYTLIKEEIIHFEMVRNYQRLVGKKYMLPSYRVAVYIRNIQLTLDNLYYEEKNEVFWFGVKNNLHTLRMSMPAYFPCDIATIDLIAETKLQIYVVDCLKRAFIHWNTLCTLQQG